MEKAKAKLPHGVTFAKDPYEAVHEADGVAIVTEWNEFRQIDLVRLAKGMKHLVLFDGRIFTSPAVCGSLGLCITALVECNNIFKEESYGSKALITGIGICRQPHGRAAAFERIRGVRIMPAPE